MGLGALATIGVQNPGNLSVAVLDNESYGETGGQKSHTGYGADLAAVARGCGIADSRIIVDEDDLQSFAARIHRLERGSAVAVIKISKGESERVLPSRDAAFLKDRFRIALATVQSS